MKRVLRTGLLAVLGGLVTVGLLFQLLVPGGLPGLLARLWPARPFDASQFKTFKVGDRFPDLTLKTADGTAIRFSDHPHKVLLVNLFASW